MMANNNLDFFPLMMSEQIIFFIMSKPVLSTPVKLALLTLAFLVIIFLGLVPLWIVHFMYQSLFIRVIIAVAGILWGIGTLIGFWIHFKYVDLWRQWFKEIRKKKRKREFQSDDRYVALLEKYPISVKHHELHYRNHHPEMSPKEVIAKALEISNEEWAEREAFHVRNHNERKAFKEHKPPTLSRGESGSSQRL